MSKYPRTPHLPWSPGLTNSERVHPNPRTLAECPLVITEKLDGSNVCLTRDNVFARSHNGPPTHESFDWLKAWHGASRYAIPGELEIFCEYTYAVHSIQYDALPSYLHVIGVRGWGEWLSWHDTIGVGYMLGLPTVPELLMMNVFGDVEEVKEVSLKLLKRNSVFGGQREGVVVRTQRSFVDTTFQYAIGKVVRADHVQTDEHWTNKAVERQNLLHRSSDK